jgi:hypothetical protein
MLIQSLLFSDAREYAAQPEMDPLTEEGALAEAQLLHVNFDALSLTLGLLFELRMALQLRESNTGLLIARGVRSLDWGAPGRATSKTAWNVVSSVPSAEAGLFRLSLGMWPEARLHLVAEAAAFYCGDVALNEAPPDYGDDDEIVRQDLANWDSEFAPSHAVFLDRSR